MRRSSRPPGTAARRGSASRVPNSARVRLPRAGYRIAEGSQNDPRWSRMAKSKPQKAKAAAEGAWGNDYVQRFVQDEELRANVKDALDNARSAYARLTNGKSASKVVMEDKKFQKDVKNAADSFKEASLALRDGPKRKRSGGFGKLLLLAIVGGGLAVALSEDVRNKVLDLLFGKEEEFDYTSTTSPPATPAPTPSA